MYTFYNQQSFPYTVGPVIGKGSYGVVYSTVHNHTGREFAMKVIPKGNGLARRELAVHMHLSDIPGTVAIEEVIDNHDYVMLFMEKYSMNLTERMEQFGPLTPNEVAPLLYDLLTWLRAVHARRIVYCDLKPNNILFADDDTFRPFMIDFGCARPMPSDGSFLRPRAGTVVFMAPEVLLKHYDMRADLWSVGVLTYYMLTGQYPLRGPGEHISREEYQRRILTYEQSDIILHPGLAASPDALHFIERLMTFEPSFRASPADALLHPFIQSNI